MSAFLNSHIRRLTPPVVPTYNTFREAVYSMWKIWFSMIWLSVESLGFPLLSEGAFGPLSTAIHKGSISLPGAYLAAYLVIIAGNSLGFFAFWHYAPAIIQQLSRRWPSLAEQLEKLEPRIRPQIFVAMAVARFVGLGTFGIVLWVAGMLKTPWKTFLVYLFFLDLVWTAAWLFASHAVVGVILTWLKGLELSEAVLYGALAVAGYFALHRLIKLTVHYWRSRTAD